MAQVKVPMLEQGKEGLFEVLEQGKKGLFEVLEQGKDNQVQD